QKGRKNVCYLAPAGVGKTALCVGLAQKVVQGQVPDYLKDARVMELDLASMASGTSTAAEFQERFIPICRGFAERYHDPSYPKFIMFIDEIHTIMPTVTGSAYRGLSEVMKPYLTVGDLHVIGATTSDEYRLFVKEDEALDRRFQKVHLDIPNDEETYKILQNIKPGYEKHHGVSMPDECLEEIVMLTTRHMRRRNQPDKSIIMMDASMAHYVMHHGRGGTVDMDSVYIMVANETGLHPGSLSDNAPMSFKVRTTSAADDEEITDDQDDEKLA
ncbi:MAG: AAA family ATPase, partial [Pseudomonadota bacterium]